MLKQTISRVLSPEVEIQGNGHSSRVSVTRYFKRPTQELRADHPTFAPLFGLAPGGVYQAPDVTIETGELLPHRFTLTQSIEREALSLGRSIFCGTFLPVTGTGCYPAPCPMELGLSSRSDIKERATILSALAIFPSFRSLLNFLHPSLMNSLQNIISDYRRDSS